MDRYMRDNLDHWLTTPPDEYDRDYVERENVTDAYGKSYPEAHEDEDDICSCPDHQAMRNANNNIGIDEE